MSIVKNYIKNNQKDVINKLLNSLVYRLQSVKSIINTSEQTPLDVYIKNVMNTSPNMKELAIIIRDNNIILELHDDTDTQIFATNKTFTALMELSESIKTKALQKSKNKLRLRAQRLLTFIEVELEYTDIHAENTEYDRGFSDAFKDIANKLSVILKTKE